MKKVLSLYGNARQLLVKVTTVCLFYSFSLATGVNLGVTGLRALFKMQHEVAIEAIFVILINMMCTIILMDAVSFYIGIKVVSEGAGPPVAF